MLDTDPAVSSKSKHASGNLRVSKPGDSFETEAERVAETVSRGGKISPSTSITETAWSFSRMDVNRVQRDGGDKPAVQGPGPKPNNYDEALKKIGEAFLKTDVGRQITDAAEKDPVVKGVEGFVDTLAGKIVVGAAATGVVSALAATHQPLPAQLPAIPLDKINPRLAGMSVKITYEGPVDRPTAASISFSYTPKAADDKKNKPSVTDQRRAQTAGLVAETYKFQEGLKTPEQRKAEADDAQHVMDTVLHRGSGIDASKYNYPNLAPAKSVGPQLTPPQFQSPLAPKAPTLLDKQLELKPATPTSLQMRPPEGEKKKEEVTVQRKAERAEPLYVDMAEVESVVASPGRPLDPETRRYMESHIGFDFGKVRVHTDDRAARSARGLGAKAYTLGGHVVFSAGRYAPKSSEGRRLLAHELTHVVQQTTTREHAHPVRRAPRQVQRSWSVLDIPGAQWLIDKVRGLKGYKLCCTVAGHDLFDESQVYERNATTLTKGVLEIFPGGDKIYEKLQNAGKAIETAYHWLEAQLKQRNLTPEGLTSVVEKAVTAFKEHPWDNRDEVIKIVQEPINSLIDLAGVIAKKVLDFILEGLVATFGEKGKKVWAFFQRAASVISDIAADPLKFGKNLLKAVGEGFKNFFAHIWEHLSTGVKTWIYEELDLPPDIKIPEDFTLGSMLRLLLQVLGLTWEYRRPQLVKKLEPIGGETVVYFFETLADKAGDVIKRIKEQGFSAIKEMIAEQAGAIFNSFVDNIKGWIAEEFIKRGLKLIAELSNPAGELIKIVESIIDTVTFVIEKAEQLADLINTVVNALADIVAGNTDPAAKKVEETLARAIPLLLRFIAGQFQLTGIGKKIREVINRIREPIDKLIGKLLDVVVEKIKPLWDKGKELFQAKLAAVKEWWLKPKKFHYGEEEHDIVVKGTAQKPEVFVHSAEEKTLDVFLTEAHATPAQKQQIHNTEKGLTHKEGEKQTAAEDETGAKKFDHLVEQMDKLKPQEAPQLPGIEDGGTNALGGGIYTEAYLRKGVAGGTGTSGAKDEPIIADLGVLRPRNKKFYVKGHLLNQGLGGLGEWKNLMPITNTVNSRMRSWLEAPLKDAAAKIEGNKAYWYRVDAKYDLSVDINKTDPTSKVPVEQQKAELAEKRLVSLSWKTRMATWTKEQGWKPNEDQLVDAKGTPLPENKPKKLREDNFTPPTER